MTTIDEEKARNDADYKRIENAAIMLSEFFDTVQIFCTRHDPEEGTTSHHHGRGNYYARRGQVETWLVKENEASRDEVRKAANDDD